MSTVGLSPAHPPVPKKPPITPKPSSKSPVATQRKHGSASGKSPVPKPKPRTPQKIAAGGSSLAQSTSNSHADPPMVASEKSNGVVHETKDSPRDLINSEHPPESDAVEEKCNNEAESLAVEPFPEVSLKKTSEDSILEVNNGHAQIAEESIQPLIPENKPSAHSQIAEDCPQSPVKQFAKKQPPPKPFPRTPNPSLHPRRAVSVFDPESQRAPTVKTLVGVTKSNSVLKNNETSNQHNQEQPVQSPAEEMPAIPTRRKRLSRETSSPVVVNKPETMDKPESETEPRNDSTSSKKATVSGRSHSGSPVRPPLPTSRKPLKQCVSSAVDEESPPPPPIPRRTDTNDNPAKARAKSEYIKKKPARPPPPAVKPSMSVALASGSATPPPPKHPKPVIRKAKSEFIPTEAPLGFTSLGIEVDDQCNPDDSDNPKVPPRIRRSKLFEDHETDASNFILQKTTYDSHPNPTSETLVDGDISSSDCTSNKSDSELNPVDPESTRKSMPLPSSTSKDSPPKLQRSLTEPERDSPPKRGPRPKVVPLRKAPPIPVKPIHSPQTDGSRASSGSDSSRSSCTGPVSTSKTPPLSPKSLSFKSQNSSPKHRPRLPPPPPPPVIRTNSPDFPEPPKRITSRSKSLDTNLTSESYDPNGNIPRTSPKSTVETENAKNSSKSSSLDQFCNRDSEDSSSSAMQSTSESMSSMGRSSLMSEDDDYVLPDPDPQSPPPSPRKVPHQVDDQIYMNKQVASVRPSRRAAPPRPVKPVLPRKTALPSSAPTSPTATCPVSPSAFKRTPGSGKLKKKPPTKPVRRSLSVNSDISNDGYEDMSKGSSLASSLSIGAQLGDLYSVPRSCEHTLHESGNCTCAQQYADQSSGDEDDGSPSDEEEEEDSYEKFDGENSTTRQKPSAPDLKGNANKAYLVAKEIRDSEKVFVDVLKLLNKDFRQAIDDAGTNEGRAVIEQLLLHQILGHLPQLQMFNEELLQDLDERVENWMDNPSISSIFLKKGPYLKLYSSYIRDFEKITTVFDEACGRFPLFGAAVRDFELSERCQNLAIKHYMLKPIQRIPQYKLLLTDYLKQLEAGTSEHAETSAALNIVSEVANHANECMRQGDNFGKLLQIQHSLIGNHEIVKPGRVFIKEGELLKLSRKVMQPRKFFLMNDILLYTTPFPPGQYKLNNVLSLAGMRVNKPQLEDFKNEFNIISVQRSFTLSANTPEERDEWIQALTRTIMDYATKRSSFSVLQPHQLIEGDTSSLGRKAPIWIPDSRVTMCMICTCEFTITWRRHHCRACGKVVCGNCSMNKVPLMYLSQKTARVCEECFNVLAKEECEDDDGNGKDRKFKSKRKRSLKETKRPAALKEVSANESDTNMSGYLHVKRKKDWKRMWFVLKGKVLYTYKASEDVAALESMPLLGYEIKVVEEYFEGIEPGLVLQLYHQGRVMNVFRTESKAAADKWAYAMIDATVL